MLTWRRVGICAAVWICIALAAVPAAAPAERVVERSRTSAGGAALAAAKEVSVGPDKTTVTLQEPGEKGTRSVVVRYSNLLSALAPASGPRALLFWGPIALLALSLALRVSCFLGGRPAQPTQAGAVAFTDRRRGERRKGERRKGERRKTGPAGGYHRPDRRVGERRVGDRRRGDRRRGMGAAPAGA